MNKMPINKEPEIISKGQTPENESYIHKWKRSQIGWIVETVVFSCGSIYSMYVFKTLDKSQGFKKQRVAFRLKLKSTFLLASTALGYLAICRVLNVGLFHPYNSVVEQFWEDVEKTKNLKEKLLKDKPTKNTKDS